MKIDEKLLKQIALEYLQGNISINDLGAKYGISKSSLIQYFKGNRTVKLPKYLQNQIDDMKAKRFIDSKSTYGNQDKTVMTKEQIINCANTYVYGNCTFEEIVKSLNSQGISITIGTLSNYFTINNLGEELYTLVRNKISEHKIHATDGIRK